ncbi:MAG: helix-turn-helix domain-containing protein, partial [Acidobacteriota bacterium]
PLRHRRADIGNLAAHIMVEESRRQGVRPAGMSRGALDALQAYDWPGNLRELRNEIARAVLFLNPGELLQSVHLDPSVVRGPAARDDGDPSSVDDDSRPDRASRSEQRAFVAPVETEDDDGGEISGRRDSRRRRRRRFDSGFGGRSTPVPSPDTPPAAGTLRASTGVDIDLHTGSLRDALDRAERERIEAALRASNTVTEAAKQLNVGRSTLYRRMKALDMDDANLFDGS